MAQVMAVMEPGCAAHCGLHAGMEHELGWDMSLSEWAALGMPGRLQMLADAQLPLRQQRGLLARLLAHEDPHERRSLLSGLMAQNAPARLQWCMDLLSQESHDCQVISIFCSGTPILPSLAGRQASSQVAPL